MIVLDFSLADPSLLGGIKTVRTRFHDATISGCLDCFVPRSDGSPTSLRGSNFALAEGCEEAISLSMTYCNEQTDYHVTSLAWVSLSPRNDESL